jgi:hypothetical protein
MIEVVLIVSMKKNDGNLMYLDKVRFGDMYVVLKLVKG